MTGVVLTDYSLTLQFPDGTEANELTRFVFGTKQQLERMHYGHYLVKY